MKTKKIVVLADIESVRVPFTSFEKALKEVSKYGDVAACKFYGYSAKRTKDYADFIADNNYDALSALPGKRKGKLDLRQVIDAVRASQYPNVDAFFILTGDGNIKPLINYLRGNGVEVYAGVTAPNENSAKCTATIILEEGPLYTDVKHSTKPAAKINAKPQSGDDDIIAKLAALLQD